MLAQQVLNSENKNIKTVLIFFLTERLKNEPNLAPAALPLAGIFTLNPCVCFCLMRAARVNRRRIVESKNIWTRHSDPKYFSF